MRVSCIRILCTLIQFVRVAQISQIVCIRKTRYDHFYDLLAAVVGFDYCTHMFRAKVPASLMVLCLGCSPGVKSELTFDSSPGEFTSQGVTSETSDTTDATSDASSSSPEPENLCGNGLIDLGEECDDGNDDNHDRCLRTCIINVCGDGWVREGKEECDDNNDSPFDHCKNDCTRNVCGDGYVLEGVEDCDDANTINTDDCLGNCRAASCGDNYVHEGYEACDDGQNTGDYGSCSPDCLEPMPACGDGIVQPEWGENCEDDPELDHVTCHPETCVLDFSKVPQLHCRNACSWAGIDYCGQEDADVFCRLRTRNPLSTAEHFEITKTLELGGFGCSNPEWYIADDNGVDPRINLGPMPEYGWDHDPLFYVNGNMRESHGQIGNDVVAYPVCTNPGSDERPADR